MNSSPSGLLELKPALVAAAAPALLEQSPGGSAWTRQEDGECVGCARAGGRRAAAARLRVAQSRRLLARACSNARAFRKALPQHGRVRGVGCRFACVISTVTSKRCRGWRARARRPPAGSLSRTFCRPLPIVRCAGKMLKAYLAYGWTRDIKILMQQHLGLMVRLRRCGFALRLRAAASCCACIAPRCPRRPPAAPLPPSRACRASGAHWAARASAPARALVGCAGGRTGGVSRRERPPAPPAPLVAGPLGAPGGLHRDGASPAGDDPHPGAGRHQRQLGAQAQVDAGATPPPLQRNPPAHPASLPIGTSFAAAFRRCRRWPQYPSETRARFEAGIKWLKQRVMLLLKVLELEARDNAAKPAAAKPAAPPPRAAPPPAAAAPAPAAQHRPPHPPPQQQQRPALPPPQPPQQQQLVTVRSRSPTPPPPPPAATTPAVVVDPPAPVDVVEKLARHAPLSEASRQPAALPVDEAVVPYALPPGELADSLGAQFASWLPNVTHKHRSKVITAYNNLVKHVSGQGSCAQGRRRSGRGVVRRVGVEGHVRHSRRLWRSVACVARGSGPSSAAPTARCVGLAPAWAPSGGAGAQLSGIGCEASGTRGPNTRAQALVLCT